MKIGMRKPSVRKSFMARTTGKAKRKMKKAVNPFLWEEGRGLREEPQEVSEGCRIQEDHLLGHGPLQEAWQQTLILGRMEKIDCNDKAFHI